MDPVKESGKEKAPEKRILIVDDDAKFRTVLCNFVEALGYSCVQANSGRLALALLERMRFLIVITDIVMPGMDGLALLRIIKERYTDVDVLIITGYGARYSATRIVQTGASDFLTKPFNMEQLGARLCKIEQEKTLRNKLYSQAVTDELTGVYNRRHFYHILEQETNRAKRQGHPLSLVLVDVNRFKKFNDRYGHVKGDRILEMTAKTFQSSVRAYVDSVFRYGGDEFVGILPEADWTTAQLIGNRVKKNFAEAAPAGLTLSMGAAEIEKDFDTETLVQVADERMYEDKAGTKGLRPSTPEVGRAKDNDHIHCLNCGSLVHWASVMCGNCLADPRVKTVRRSGMRGRSIDRRRSPRIVLRKTVLHDGLITMVCNISARGMQIKTKRVLSAGEVFRIAFSLEDGMIRLSGHVVYANNLSDGSLLAGVRFSEVLGKGSDLLGRFLESHEVKPSGTPGGILGAIPHDSRPERTEEAMMLPG